MASEVKKDGEEEFENGAFASTEAHDRHSPGEAGVARREPVPDEADLAAIARERKEHVVGDISDFPAGSHRLVTAGGRQIGIFRLEGRVSPRGRDRRLPLARPRVPYPDGQVPSLSKHQSAPLRGGRRRRQG
jgi:hypothetical protein